MYMICKKKVQVLQLYTFSLDNSNSCLLLNLIKSNFQFDPPNYELSSIIIFNNIVFARIMEYERNERCGVTSHLFDVRVMSDDREFYSNFNTLTHGCCSVLFCFSVYLRKKTRNTRFRL